MDNFSEINEDKSLWNKLKAGDKNAFNSLFRRYYSELFYYGLKIIPTPDHVEECIQEVFIRIWETRKNLSDAKNVKSYLLISLRRMILVEKEKNKKHQKVVIDNLSESYSFLFEENEFEKHKEINEDVRKVLLEAINSLTGKQRELIMLFFYYELSYTEISEVMAISIQAARNLMYRTLMRLREALGTESIKTIQDILFFFFQTRTKKNE